MANSRGRGRLATTIRFRITAVATLVVLGMLIAASVGLVTVQRRTLTQNLDETIGHRADEIEELIVDDRLPRTLRGLGEDDTVAQVVVGGDVVASSANVAGEPPLADGLPRGRTEALGTVDTLPNDPDDFRLLSRRVDGPDGPAVIHVAGILDEIKQSTHVLARSLLVAVPVVAILLAALIWWLVGHTLRPVEAIRTEVADIGGSDLHRRVPVPTGDDEIARLARTMNDMLERVDHSARRQQRFVADASHELRSPLTRIRSELEVDLAHPGGADLAATHESILEETIGLQRLVDDLLHLARSDAGETRATEPRPVDLDDIVVRLARRLRADERITVDTSDVGAAQVYGDPDQLTRAVGNLADNAARHATSTVTFGLAEGDKAAVLTVRDDGPGIAREHHDRVFERFARLDHARNAAIGGTGLGLAIVRDIVQRHGGTITIDPDQHPGARFVITLPLWAG